MELAQGVSFEGHTELGSPARIVRIQAKHKQHLDLDQMHCEQIVYLYCVAQTGSLTGLQGRKSLALLVFHTPED